MASYIPKLQANEEVIWFNDDLEQCMPKSKVDEVKKLWNQGLPAEFIATKVKADEWEVLFCVIHLFRNGYKIRPFK
ncbi:hypothetical protein SAMN05421676_11238 [Salinibacillus kushneri]|uniref:Uncharacterized protein n=1 Tax=Salinibacillus kushneri TaxID=237682 RepID=A0A1I0IGL7_9BACI|nr:hypothetical protein [Salinibacillus kushneri]SET95235.1 hypothetical protein SAMN05421676_11238 [Salinibacillus kushneri]